MRAAMNRILDYPFLVLALSLLALWLSAQSGSYLRRRRGKLDEGVGHDLGTILAATLTLLALIIGFTFSMANSRYDQRKGCEASEANAIGTEYVRSELLPTADAAKVQGLLKRYLDQRILFYTTRDGDRLQQIRGATAQLQTELWSAVRKPSIEQRTPTVATGRCGYERCSELGGLHAGSLVEPHPNCDMVADGGDRDLANVMLGYTAKRPEARIRLFFILPLIVPSPSSSSPILTARAAA